MSAFPFWQMSGVIADPRPLHKKDGTTVWAYSVKLIAMGGTYEIRVGKEQKDLFDQLGDGEEHVLNGHFDLYNGRLQLQLKGIGEAHQSKMKLAK